MQPRAKPADRKWAMRWYRQIRRMAAALFPRLMDYPARPIMALLGDNTNSDYGWSN
jgi:hypothetical protein